MKRTLDIFTCDGCGKVLSNDDKAIPHLSLHLGNASGWVHKEKQAWLFDYQPIKNVWAIHQFCDTECLRMFFKNPNTYSVQTCCQGGKG